MNIENILNEMLLLKKVPTSDGWRTSIEDTTEILKGLRERYEQHHRQKLLTMLLKLQLILEIVIYPIDFCLITIDLIDEAGSRVRLINSKLPPKLNK